MTFKYRLRGIAQSKVVIVVGVLVALVAVAVPAFLFLGHHNDNPQVDPVQLAKEAQLRGDLSHFRSASYQFMQDTNYYPITIQDFGAKTAADLSTPYTVIDGYGKLHKISAKCFKGPYMPSVPNDPISGQPYIYSTTPGSVGNINSSAQGIGSDGEPYSKW